MNFDLNDIDTKKLSEAGVALQIKRLDGTPLVNAAGESVTITLLGPDSAKYRALTRESIKKRLDRRVTGASDVTMDDLDQIERETIEILVVCTVGWTGVRTPEGETIACTQDNARRLYENYPVVREQVDAFVGNRANFLQASSGR